MTKKIVVFDLDDTIYKEIDFVRSAYNDIAKVVDPDNHFLVSEELFRLYKNGQPAFELILKQYPETTLALEDLLNMYKYESHSLDLPDASKQTFSSLNKLTDISLGLLTDGRSISQRNKLTSLGIADIFEHIVVSEEIGSEKPHPNNYLSFEKEFPGCSFYYIGDNVRKDFVSPNRMGWTTICLLDDDGRNIHPQHFNYPKENLPQHRISSLTEVIQIL